VSFHRRRLPHIYAPGQSLFVSWHLHGSLPRSAYPPGKLLSGQAFASVDHHLDAAPSGPVYLRQEAVAQIVVDSIRQGAELGHYILHAFVVMPNHVHVLLTPQVPPSRLLKSLKGCTAREANRILGRTGETFWQRESYDHWVRNQAEFQRIGAYIENNPVKAGLAARASDYPWSSAAQLPRPGVEMSLDAARTSAYATKTCLSRAFHAWFEDAAVS
jgi:putative transposase